MTYPVTDTELVDTLAMLLARHDIHPVYKGHRDLARIDAQAIVTDPDFQGLIHAIRMDAHEQTARNQWVEDARVQAAARRRIAGVPEPRADRSFDDPEGYR